MRWDIVGNLVLNLNSKAHMDVRFGSNDIFLSTKILVVHDPMYEIC